MAPPLKKCKIPHKKDSEKGKGLLENLGCGFFGENIKKFKKIEVKNIFGSILRWHPITLLLTHLVSYHR